MLPLDLGAEAKRGTLHSTKFQHYWNLSIKLFRVISGYSLGESYLFGGARGVMVIVVGNEHGDTSSNPGRD